MAKVEPFGQQGVGNSPSVDAVLTMAQEGR
jgi:hypothetical protein